MTERLDRRKELYSGPRLSDAQVKTLLVLEEHTTVHTKMPQLAISPAYLKTFGGNPKSLDFLQREHLAREVEPGWWCITPQGLELLRDIREAMLDD